jgi:hypothetical protein
MEDLLQIKIQLTSFNSLELVRFQREPLLLTTAHLVRQ